MESEMTKNALNNASKDVEECIPAHFFSLMTVFKLSDGLQKNRRLNRFLILSGFLLPSWSEVENIYHAAKFYALVMLSWVVRLGIPFTGVYLICDNFIYKPDGVTDNILYFQGVGLLLQFLSIIPFIIMVKKRLNNVAPCCELELYPKSIQIPYIFCMVAFLFSLLYYFIRPEGSTANAVNKSVQGYKFIQSAHYEVVAFGAFLLTVTMSVYLMFILVDIEVSRLIVQDLMEKTKNKELTVEYYDESRREIKRRVKEHLVPATAVILVGFLNTVSYFLRIFVSGTSQGIGAVFSANNYYMKEILFIVICYYKASVVNELADANIKQLGYATWGNSELEMKRLQVFVNASSHPISFELAGLRFKRQDVSIKLGGVVLASVVGFIRLLVISHKVELHSG